MTVFNAFSTKYQLSSAKTKNRMFRTKKEPENNKKLPDAGSFLP